jgi:hypothetical protein
MTVLCNLLMCQSRSHELLQASWEYSVHTMRTVHFMQQKIYISRTHCPQVVKQKFRSVKCRTILEWLVMLHHRLWLITLSFFVHVCSAQNPKASWKTWAAGTCRLSSVADTSCVIGVTMEDQTSLNIWAHLTSSRTVRSPTSQEMLQKIVQNKE